MGSTNYLERGRRAYAAGEWRTAHEALLAAHRTRSLPPEDLWRLALASYLVGRVDDFVQTLQEAHQAFLEAGDSLEAVRTAFWMGQHLADKGEIAQASGWFGRAARLVDGSATQGAGNGYVLLQSAHQRLIEGDYDASARTCAEAAVLGQRVGDQDLAALAIHLQGRALLRVGRLEEGLTLLDEAMVAVTSDDLSPVATGLIYCSVLAACREVNELRRATEWTAALSEWCERQPDMVAYSGECLVARAEIHHRRGDWSRALDEARQALERFRQAERAGRAGPAFYRQGEVHRLRGEYAAAEEAYRAASRSGREPQPGLALLRLAQAEPQAAAATVRRALAETADPLKRAGLLPALIEILLELGDLGEAEGACGELEETARRWGGELLDNAAKHARGAIALASGKPEDALAPLRRAWQGWDAIDAPHEAARVRVLLAAACAALGDQDGAALELDAARAELEQLGAAHDLARLTASTDPAKARAHGLTPREREVLACLATGRSNRAIAEALFISEKTVGRHLANIYRKLGLSSRAAATAYAYEHDLLGPRT